MSLPALQPKMSAQSFPPPRRYEETKPAQMQYLTHRQIVDLGEGVHRRSVERDLIERQAAVHTAEQAVWAQAEIDKEAAIKKLYTKLEAEHEKHVKRLLKTHKEALKQEALRVESEMKQLAIDNVQKEREEGEIRLKEAVAKTEKRCEEEKQLAVIAARKLEKQAAAQEALHVAIKQKEKLKAALAKAEIQKQEALAQQLDEQKRILETAVKDARREEQEHAANEMLQLGLQHEYHSAELIGCIFKLQKDVETLKKELSIITDHKQNIITEFTETRDEFQKFIDQTRPFHIGESKFVLPDAKSIDKC